MKTVAITGHRPEKIRDPDKVKKLIKLSITDDLLADFLIQGMASGVDLWSAVIARQLGMLYECAKPWAGHKPRKADAKLYEEVLHFADKVTDISPALTYPGPWIYQTRNEYMVDPADMVLAVWDGTPGGTANCVKYAEKQKKPIFRIDEIKQKRGWYANSPLQK